MHKHYLSDEEWKELERFRFFKYDSEKIGWELSEYEDKQAYERYLNKVADKLEVNSTHAAASIFFKRVAFLFIGYLYMISVHNKKLNITDENVFLVDFYNDKKMWIPQFYIKDASYSTLLEGDRAKILEEAISQFYNELFYPLIDNTYKITRVSKLVLWENIAVYVYWMYSQLLSMEELNDKKEQLEVDRSIIVNDAPGYWFGKVNQNPFKKLNFKQVYVEEYDKLIRPRSTCCYSYMAENVQSFCSSCPKKECFTKMSKRVTQ